MTLDDIAGVAHEPDGPANGAVMLTHGAGGNRDAPLLIRLCDEWARRGWLAIRYNLPYRRRRPKGPPSGSAATDQAGIVEAIEFAHTLTDGPVLAGGHSYGGRMTSMVAAAGSVELAGVRYAGDGQGRGRGCGHDGVLFLGDAVSWGMGVSVAEVGDGAEELFGCLDLGQVTAAGQHGEYRRRDGVGVGLAVLGPDDAVARAPDDVDGEV